jgi:hypothetical protein
MDAAADRSSPRTWKWLATISLAAGVAFSALGWALIALDVRLDWDFAFVLVFPAFALAAIVSKNAHALNEAVFYLGMGLEAAAIVFAAGATVLLLRRGLRRRYAPRA